MKKFMYIMAILYAASIFSGCYTEIEADPPSVRSGLLPIAGAYNVRDLGIHTGAGGKKIKSGKLIRSGDLNLLTERDKTYLFGTLGIKTVVDFRGKLAGIDGDKAVISERNNSPDRLWNDVVSVWQNTAIEESLLIGSYEDIIQQTKTPQEAKEQMENGYKKLLTGTVNAKGQYREFFSTLLAANGNPVLFHCSAGKDRTGVAAMLLLSALGVDDQTIINDYLLSEANVAEKYYPVAHFIVKSTRESMKARRDDPAIQQLAAALNGPGADYVKTNELQPRVSAGIKNGVIAGLRGQLVNNGMDINQANSLSETELENIMSLDINALVAAKKSELGGDSYINTMVDAQALQITQIAAMTDAAIEQYAILAGEKVKPLVTVKESYIDAAFRAIYAAGFTSVYAYLISPAGLDLTAAQIDQLQNLYLE
jgi:protein-tyrosine phosphatase